MWPSSFFPCPFGPQPLSCEDRGLTLRPALAEGLEAPFGPEELRRGFARAKLDTAVAHAGRAPWDAREASTAVWVLGASAVGKSSVASTFARRLGIPAVNGEPDAVLIDGDLLRLEHAGYQAVVADGQAYPALRGQLRDGKEVLLREAVRRRQHLLIPHTCQRLETDCLGVLRTLSERGYVNHIVVVEGDRREVQRRGERRAQLAGKRYAAEEYEQSLRSFEPMAQIANGQVLRVWNTGSPTPRVTAQAPGGASPEAAGRPPPPEAGAPTAASAARGGARAEAAELRPTMA